MLMRPHPRAPGHQHPRIAAGLSQLAASGEPWDCISYAEQANRAVRQTPLSPKFAAGQRLLPGRPLFYGQGLAERLQSAARLERGALIFAYPVRDPKRYGVVEFDANGLALSIEEKPAKPRSHYAVPGLYFYDEQVHEIAAHLQPSARGELEITDLNRVYLEKGQLRVDVMGRGIAWLDAGTHESLLQAANYVQAVEDRQGMMISCPEEIAYRMGYITREELKQQALVMNNNQYGEYLMHLLEEELPASDIDRYL